MTTNDETDFIHYHDTEYIPFGKVIGVTDDGVPVFSNGEKNFFSQQISVALGSKPFGLSPPIITTSTYDNLGYKWLCLEFARRYLAMTKGVWLASLPTPEDIWNVNDIFTYISNGEPVMVSHEKNGETTNLPSTGDLMIWGCTSDIPIGHVGVITHVTENWICVAEQNMGFKRWSVNENYNRQIKRKIRDDKIIEFINDTSLIGWIKINAPLYDFSLGDLPDNYRHILSSGNIIRHHIEREVSLPWLNTSERCDFFLKRSLTINGNMGEDAVTEENDVPDGYYLMDYDIWSRFRYAVNSLHEVAMEATRRIINDPDSEALLLVYFGIPKELHGQLRRSFETTPAMGGRFDFGYNGKDIIMLEYNCDSSAAMLECGDTQDKIARHYGINIGTSTGSFLYSKFVEYFKSLLKNKHVCPRHKIIHFMIDDNDEERYTALYTMNAAEIAGFRTKLCVKLTDFRFINSLPNTEISLNSTDQPIIVDLENEEVLLVWKTWAWDTVLHQYAEQRIQNVVDSQLSKPSLSDILLNERIRVLEPLWKAITGSKAILPFMYASAPNHSNMVPASFHLSKEIISSHYLSKPVNGRAGQNIMMFDPEKDPETIAAALHTVEAPVLGKSVSVPLFEDTPGSVLCNSFDEANESSTGKFFNSTVIYQRRVFLKKYEHKYFPIFCGWNVGGEFGGLVIREDTSKITKLSSIVIPARVVREHKPLYPTQKVA